MSGSRKPRVVCIAWAAHSNRLDAIAKGLGGHSVKISLLSGRKFLAPIRYLYLAVKTFSSLRGLDADLVVAQNPPIFCPLSAYFYTRAHGKKFIIDCHSLARDNLRHGILWRALARLESYLMRRALVNTVIHEAYSVELERLGVKSLVLYDSLPVLDPANKKCAEGLRVIAPLGGHPDEDIASLLKVADDVEGIEVLVTGKWKDPVRHRQLKYLGFLPREDYLKLLQESKAGICLLQGNEMTLPYILFEFASAGLPFIVTETLATKMVGEAFLVRNAKEAAEKLEGMKNGERYASAVGEVERLRDALMEKSREGMQELQHIVEPSGQ